MTKPKIAVVLGSDSDLPTMEVGLKLLKDFGAAFELRILSAHRSPDDTALFAKRAEGRGIKVIIAGAGGAAHLAGVIASNTTLPVIGVPIRTQDLKGIDSLLSIAQMPGGVPVGTMAIGEAGAKNAAIFAVEILAVEDTRLKKKLAALKKKMRLDIRKKDKDISKPC